MTGSAVILVSDPALAQLAQGWVSAGLMGPIMWLDSAVARVPMDVGMWQAAEGCIYGEGDPVPVRLQEALASEGALRGIVIVWVHDDTDDVAEGMTSVRAFAQRIIHQNTEPRLFDLLAPTRPDGLTVPSRVQGWEQLVVVPEDRPEVEAPDAGWLNRRDAVLLHTAAAVAGRLGGRSVPLPSASNADLRMVSVWSRHGLGAESLRREAVEFLDLRLPEFCARDVRPHEFAVFAEEREQARTVVAWLRAHLSGQLAYEREPARALDVDARRAPRGSSPAVEARRADPDEAPGASSARTEQEWCKATDRELNELRRSDGELPPGALWRDVVQLLTASVDGGELPRGFSETLAHDHRLVVRPQVAGPDRQLTLGSYPEHENDVPELIHSPPTEVAAEALAGAIGELAGEASGGVGFPADCSGLSGMRLALASALSDDDRRDQEAQRTRLVEVGLEATHPQLSIADSLWAMVMGDALRARLDAQRWHQVAVADWPTATPGPSPWTIAGWAVSALATAFGVLWLAFGERMNELIANAGWGPWDPTNMGVAGLIVAVVAAAASYLLRPSRVDDGYWSWRMALRLQLKLSAADAYRDAGRLNNALRIYSYWWLVLREIFPLRGEDEDPGDEAELVVPRALQYGPVEVHAPYRDLVLNQAGVEPGWRMAAVRELAARALAKYADVSYVDALSAVFEDSGYSEGALHRLQRDTGSSWEELRADWIDEAVLEAKGDLVGPASGVGGEHRPQKLSAFLDEVRRHRTTPRLWHDLVGVAPAPQSDFVASTSSDDGAPPSITPATPALACAALVVTCPLRLTGIGTEPEATQADGADENDPY